MFFYDDETSTYGQFYKLLILALFVIEYLTQFKFNSIFNYRFQRFLLLEL
jgi:hypothetical protein